MVEDVADGDFAKAIINTVTQPLLVLAADHSVIFANPAFFKHFQVSPEESLGRPLHELGNGQWDIPELRDLLRQVAADGAKIGEYRVEHDFPEIGRRIMIVSANRMQQQGQPARILLAISDITKGEELTWELEKQKEFAEKLIDSLREPLLVLDPDLRVRSANQSFYDHFKVSPEETAGRLIYELGSGQWNIPELRALLEKILPEHSTFDDYKVSHDFEPVGQRTMLLNARRLDHLDLILLAIEDITEQERYRLRERTIRGELEHRVKNILVTVRALALQTRRTAGSIEDFFDKFEARLAALGRTQDLLINRPAEPVSLRDIIKLELGAVGAEKSKQYTIDGPRVRLPPREAQAMAMTIHELTTNALKYGALRSENGRIRISWRVEENDPKILTFCWEESGIPLAATEPKKGFGSRVIERNLPHMLGGAAELQFRPDGAFCHLSFPLRE